VADLHGEIDGREDGDVAVRLDPVRADHRPHDVQVRVVDGVHFLAGRGDGAERLRVDDLVAAEGGLADLAHADAAIDTRDTHTGGGHDRGRRPVLGERGGGGVDPR
jgi:hypothetical protein